MTIDWKQVRNDFPILQREINEQPLIYLDNAATAQKPAIVLEGLKNYYEQSNANVYRSVHTLSGEATEQYERAREKVRKFIHAGVKEEVIFTSGTTESINLLARILESNLTVGDEILLTVMEHHSNIIPWQQLAKRTGAKLIYVELTAEGKINLKDYQSKLSDRTKIISFTHVSNVLGTLNPVKEMVRLSRKTPAFVIVDGAQATGHFSVDVQKLDVDFYAFSGHKMYGPTGIGVLYGKKEHLEKLEPVSFGGEMIELVQEQTSTWAALPHKFEAGTPNIAGAIGLGLAIDYISAIGLENIAQHEQDLLEYLFKQIQTIEGMTIYGPQAVSDRLGVISFNLDDIHPHDVATALDVNGIAIRAGHHCAQLLMKRLNVLATSRISLSFYNTKEELGYLVQSIKQTKEFFSL